MHFAIDDEQGNTLATGDRVAELRERLSSRVRAEVARQAPIEERRGVVAWDFGDLPSLVEFEQAGLPVRGYPALLDVGDSVSIRVLTNPELQTRVMRAGVRRLLILAVPVAKRAVERSLTNQLKLAIAGSGVVTLDELETDCLTAAADAVMLDHGGPTFTEDGFRSLVAAARDDLADRAATALRRAAEVCAAAQEVSRKLDRLVAPNVATAAREARSQLARLVRPGFVLAAGVERLLDIVRYVNAIEQRLEKLPEDPHRDAARLREVIPLEQRYGALLQRLPREAITPELVDLGWQLEELRVSVFAQSLGAARGVSASRIAKALQSHGG
jgi:ATP-dependent helicase HrpA